MDSEKSAPAKTSTEKIDTDKDKKKDKKPDRKSGEKKPEERKDQDNFGL
jgi:hypothetical protein